MAKEVDKRLMRMIDEREPAAPTVRLTDISTQLALKDREVIGIYGAGGKTTLLYRLAQELSEAQKRVLVTTTTKIYRPEEFYTVVIGDFLEAREMLRSCFNEQKVVVLGSALLPGNKLEGIDRTWPERFLHDGVVDYVLVETDGAASKAIKGYADHEPVLPENATLLLPIIGLDALGRRLVAEYVHRPEHLAGIIGALPNERLTEKHLCLCMAHMMALGRFQASGARLIPLFNKADLITDSNNIMSIIDLAARILATDQLLFTALQEPEGIRFALRRKGNGLVPRLACVVLAAGRARRMGEDKLCLELDGKPLLAHAVENALASGVDQIVVVTRPGSDWVHRLFTDSRVKVVINYTAEEGQSSSVRVGLQAVEPLTQAVFFTLGDQPFIQDRKSVV